jgi:hypothetical protein
MRKGAGYMGDYDTPACDEESTPHEIDGGKGASPQLTREFHTNRITSDHAGCVIMSRRSSATCSRCILP